MGRAGSINKSCRHPWHQPGDLRGGPEPGRSGRHIPKWDRASPNGIEHPLHQQPSASLCPAITPRSCGIPKPLTLWCVCAHTCAPAGSTQPHPLSFQEKRRGSGWFVRVSAVPCCCGTSATFCLRTQRLPGLPPASAIPGKCELRDSSGLGYQHLQPQGIAQSPSPSPAHRDGGTLQAGLQVPHPHQLDGSTRCQRVTSHAGWDSMGKGGRVILGSGHGGLHTWEAPGLANGGLAHPPASHHPGHAACSPGVSGNASPSISSRWHWQGKVWADRSAVPSAALGPLGPQWGPHCPPGGPNLAPAALSGLVR
ncbi:uncharacterized protein ACIBXB_000688 [Morphnus guianensis]